MRTYTEKDSNRPQLIIEGMPEHYTYYFRNYFDSDIWYDYVDENGDLKKSYTRMGKATFKKDITAHNIISELLYQQKYKGVDTMSIEEIITLIESKM